MRVSVSTSLSLLSVAAAGLAALPILAACIQHPVKPVQYDPSQLGKTTLKVEVNKDVDILFVLDNSGSMGEEQARLVQNFPPLIDTLEEEDVRALYRIGITTSDVGSNNDGCSGSNDTTPEDGALQFIPCRTHLDDFLFPPPPFTATADVRDLACNNICTAEASAALEDGALPTVVAGSDAAEPRPWIERLGYNSTDPNFPDTNLPGGLSTIEAFQCLGPQGIAGCGFESQLEGQFRALQRVNNQADAGFGFLRDRAILAVVQVTDEADCSANKGLSPAQLDEVFRNNGGQVFWEDPVAFGQASSAICWNAGVACTPAKIIGNPQQYTECHSQNYGVDGSSTSNPDNAVLYPMSRYTEQFNALQDTKNDNNAGDIIFAAIFGVPEGYPGTALVYEDEPFSGTNDGNHFTGAQATLEQALFGIGKGCVSGAGTAGFQSAIPPVRLREFAEAYRSNGDDNQPINNMFSICADSYVGAMQLVADRIRSQFQPACYTACVDDVDEATEGVQPDCIVTQSIDNGAAETVSECEAGGVVPEGEELCFVYRLRDPGPGDATLSPECEAEGWNLEFDIVRAGPAPAGAQIDATCGVSDLPQLDCPELFD